MLSLVQSLPNLCLLYFAITLGYNKFETMPTYKTATCEYCGQEFRSRLKEKGEWTRFHKSCFYRSDDARKSHETWTADEEKLLAELYPRESKEQILAKISNHSWAAIQLRAEKHLNLRRATYFRYIRGVDPSFVCSDTDLAYIAGLLDGEGSCGFHGFTKNHTPSPIVSICNTYLGAIQFVQDKVQIGYIRPDKRRIENRKQGYTWAIASYEPVLLFLKAVMPYLIIKRWKAELMVRYCGSRIDQLKNSYSWQAPPHTDEQVALLVQMTGKSKDTFIA